MEFVWRGSRILGEKSDIFTHVLHTHYSAPRGYDWEDNSSPQINPQNAQQRAQQYVHEMQRRATAYRTDQLMVVHGDDFKFVRADVQFKNIDALIQYITEHKDQFPGVEIQYSTPSIYFDEVVKYANEHDDIHFPYYKEDFFPYADNGDSYWTGYYTTRPILKKLIRSVTDLVRQYRYCIFHR